MESVTHNPYLEDYYKDMRRWALNLEVFFLKERFRDLLAINRSKRAIVQDRSIYEGSTRACISSLPTTTT